MFYTKPNFSPVPLPEDVALDKPEQPTAGLGEVFSTQEEAIGKSRQWFSYEENRKEAFREHRKKIKELTGEDMPFSDDHSGINLRFEVVPGKEVDLYKDWHQYQRDGGTLGFKSFYWDRFEQNWRERSQYLAEKYPQHRDAILPPALSFGDQAREIAAAAEKKADEAWARSKGVSPYLAWMAAEVKESFKDPLMVGTMPLQALVWAGRAARGLPGLAEAFFKSGAVNAGFEVGMAPLRQGARRDLGLEFGVAEAAKDIGGAFLIGGALDAGVRGIARTGRFYFGYEPVLDDAGKVMSYRKKLVDGRTVDVPPAVHEKAEAGDATAIRELVEKEGIKDPVALQELAALEADQRLTAKPSNKINDVEHEAAITQATRHIEVPELEPVPIVREVSTTDLRDLERLQAEARDQVRQLEARTEARRANEELIYNPDNDPKGREELLKVRADQDKFRAELEQEIATRDIEIAKVRDQLMSRELQDLQATGQFRDDYVEAVIDHVPSLEMQARVLQDLAKREPATPAEVRHVLNEILQSPDYRAPTPDVGPAPQARGLKEKALNDPYGPEARAQVEALMADQAQELGLAPIQRGKPGEAPAPAAPRPPTAIELTPDPIERQAKVVQAVEEAVADVMQTRRVVTPDGSRAFNVRVELVELDDLNFAAGALQPRDRTRAESAVGSRKRAAELNPSLLMPAPTSDMGAPIISAKNEIVSGNGRVESIGIAYREIPERAAAYKASLGEQAAGMRQPILIQRITDPLTDADLVAIADLSNRSSIAGMSATERALRDARAAAPIMELYQGGSFTSPANREFYQTFLRDVVTESERPTISRDGVLTKEGEDRLSGAVLAAAYGDPTLLSRMLESTDDNIRSVTGALRDAAGGFIRLKAAIARGEASAQFDITPQIVEAATRIADLRERNMRVDAFLAQIDAFNQIDPMVEHLLRAFHTDKMARTLSRQKLTEILTRYADEAAKHNDGGLIPDTTTPRDVLDAARSRALAGEREAATQGALSFASGAVGTDYAGGGGGVLGRQLDGAGPLVVGEGRGLATPENVTRTSAVVDAAIAEFDRMAGGTGVGFQVFDRVTELPARLADAVRLREEAGGGRVAAFDDARTNAVYVSMAALREGEIARVAHEVTHALERLGILQRGDVALLAERAKLVGDDVLAFDRASYEADFRARGLSDDEVAARIQSEEAAHLIEARRAGRDFGREINGIIDRVLQFLERLRNKLAGYGFQTADDVVEAILSGEMAKRQMVREAMAAEDITAMAMRPAELDAPNFGLPEPPRTLQDGDPLLRPRDADTSPERLALRERLIEQRFEGKRPVAAGQTPVVYLMGGGGASGKGSILKRMRESGTIDNSFVQLDPDSFKTGDKGLGWDGLPEYWEIDGRGDARGADVTHEESSLIYKAAQKRGMDGRYNLVLDQTLGNPAKGEALIRSLKAAGYEVRLVGVTVDPATAVQRAVDRAKGAERRFVPLDRLLEAHKGFSAGWERYVDLADDVTLYDNKDVLPQIIAEKQLDKRLSIVAAERYNEFIAKAGLNEKATTLRDIQGSQGPLAGSPRQDNPGRVEEGNRGAQGGPDPQRPQDGADLPGRGLTPPKDVMFAFAGERAKTADLDKLAKAKALEADGADRTQIWQETGWFRGVDQKWRFETDDSRSLFDVSAMKPMNFRILGETITALNGRTGDVMQNVDLLSAYPQLADISTTQGRGDFGGMYSGSFRSRLKPAIALNFEARPDAQSRRSTMLHELQHGAQDIERYAQGGDPSGLQPTRNPAFEAYQRAVVEDPRLKEFNDLRTSEAYQKELAISNARWRDVYEPRMTEVEKAWDAARAETGRRSPEAKAIREQINAIFAEAEAENAKLPIMARLAELEAALRADGIPTFAPKATLSPEEVYWQLAGEVEARTVQRRMNMTPEERAKRPPWEDYDIPESDQIVQMPEDRGPMFAMSLDMSPEARKARAEAMGFDTSTVWYHGSNRVDRIAEAGKFDPKRATSGPMAFFSDNPELSSSYAKNKADTSIMDDGDVTRYFTVEPKALGISGRTPITAERSWYFLKPDQKRVILEQAKRVGYENIDQATGPWTLHPEGVDASLSSSHFDYLMKTDARGNPLAALRMMWLEGGDLVGREDELAKIFELAGYPHSISQKTAPWFEAQGVVPVYLKMRNPLDTTDAATLRDVVLPRLEETFRSDRTRTKQFGADAWDKNTRWTPKEWVAQLKEDVEAGRNGYVWTSIPDKITAALKELGFDGILDRGNKGAGGIDHQVAIPFAPDQVRSVNARFDPAKDGQAGIMFAMSRDRAPAMPERVDVDDLVGRLSEMVEPLATALRGLQRNADPVSINMDVGPQGLIASLMEQADPANLKILRDDSGMISGVEYRGQAYEIDRGPDGVIAGLVTSAERMVREQQAAITETAADLIARSTPLAPERARAIANEAMTIVSQNLADPNGIRTGIADLVQRTIDEMQAPMFAMTDTRGRVKPGAEMRREQLAADLAEIELRFQGAEGDERAKLQAKRVALLSSKALEERIDVVNSFKDAKGRHDPAKALLFIQEANPYQTAGADLVTLRNVIEKSAWEQIGDVLWNFRKGAVTGDLRRRGAAMQADMADMIRAATGEKVDNPMAKAFADAWLGVAEMLRQRFNAAGGDIPKLRGWFLPQFHDAEALLKVGREEWIRYLMQPGVIDRKRMTNYLTGVPLTDSQLRQELRNIYEAVTTDGQVRLDPAEASPGRGALYKRHAEHREIHFKNADAYLAYNKLYGGGDVYAAMVGYINMMSRDIAAMEILGPNPQLTWTRLKAYVQNQVMTDPSLRVPTLVADLAERVQAFGEATGESARLGSLMDQIDATTSRLEGLRDRDRNRITKRHADDIAKAETELAALAGKIEDVMAAATTAPEHHALVGDIQPLLDDLTSIQGYGIKPSWNSISLRNPQSRSNYLISRADAMWAAYTGASGSPVAQGMAATSAGLRNWVSASALVFAPFSSIADQATQMAGRIMTGIPVTSQLTSFVKAFGKEDRQLALSVGIGLDAVRNAFAERAAMVDRMNAQSWTSFVADRTHALSFLSPMTSAQKVAYALDFQRHMATLMETSYEKLGPATRRMFERHDITPADWDLIRSAVPDETSGVKMLTRRAIADAVGLDVAEKYMMMLFREAAGSTLEASARGRTFYIGETRPGTAAGEGLRSVAMLKSFPTTYAINVIGRIYYEIMAGRGFAAQTVGYAAAIVIGGTLLGAVSKQLKALGQGRDPQDMTTAKFWAQAWMQSGGVGILGDFIQSSVARTQTSLEGTIAGPMVSSVLNPALGITFGNIGQYARDEKTNIGRESVNLLRRNTPGALVPWYLRLAYERQILDALQERVDPEAYRDFAKKRTYWRRTQNQDFYWPPGASSPQTPINFDRALGR